MKKFTWRWRLLVGTLLILVCGAGVPDFIKAIKTDDVQAVKKYLESNPRLTDFKDTNGYTPLHLAAAQGQSEIVSLLLTHGADVNATAQDGFTPLHAAAVRGNLEVVQVLLERQANVNAKTAKGDTPLLLASMEDHKEVAQLLRKHGGTISGASVLAEVGSFGDPMQIDFEGNETFSASELRRCLTSDSPFLIAAHPLAPRSELQQILPARLRTGYQFKGFPDAKVSATFDESSRKTHVQIWEGPRYKAGKVSVKGAKRVSAEEIIRRLSKPHWTVPVLEQASKPNEAVTLDVKVLKAAYNQAQFLNSSGGEVKREQPIWASGDWANFASVPNYEKNVTSILGQLGWLQSRVEVSVVRHDVERTADLEVNILDEGRLPTLAEIEITGNKRNSREDILNYLELKPRMPSRPDLISELEHRLWNSARFMRYQIVPEPWSQDTNQIKLTLNLQEHEKVSLLRQPFSREEAAMLKFREWLLNAIPSGEDFILSHKSKEGHELIPHTGWRGMQIILSSNGVLWQAFMTNSAAPIASYAFESAADRFALFAPLQQAKWISGFEKQRTTVFLKWLPQEDKETKAQTHLTFGAGFNGGDTVESNDPPVRLDLFLAPVVLALEPHREGTTNTWDNGVLRLRGGGGELRIEEKTGRFLSLTLSEVFDNIDGEVTYERGAFLKARKALDAATAAHRNVCDPNRPITAAVRFTTGVLSSLLSSEDPQAALNRTRAAAVIQKILASGVLTPLDEFFKSASTEKTESFFIPVTEPENSSQVQTLVKTMSGYIFNWSSQLFPPGSWPWSLTREVVYVLGAKANYTQLEMKRLYDSDQMGPVGLWSVSQLLRMVSWPQSRVFAARGLERLSSADFRKDWQLILTAKTPFAESITRTLQATRDLSDEDLDALANLLQPANALMLRAAVQSLRADKTKAPAEILTPFLDAWWEKSLRPQFEASFKNLQNPPKR